MERQRTALPRLMIAAASSGSGKTALTCGLLCLLRRKGYRLRSFKCGPDYIDPMFHTKVLGTPSKNIDTFFADPPLARRLFWESARLGDLAVAEGVMGFYDGLGGTDLKASSYEVSRVLKMPVLLVVNGRGMSRSIVPLIRGFASYQPQNGIGGVILNQVSGMMYPRLKQMIEEETGLRVYGYAPVCEEARLESRHLGLVLPEEIRGLQKQVESFADILEHTLDTDGIAAMAEAAEEWEMETTWNMEEKTVKEAGEEEAAEDRGEASRMEGHKPAEEADKKMSAKKQYDGKQRVRIGIAMDEAFCFYYEDSLALYRKMGAELVPFSPLRDEKLPEGVSGLLLGGGYPELLAKDLFANASMRREIQEYIKKGLPCRAECGGFLYLHRELEGADGVWYPMADVLPYRAFRTKRLGRFGYITLEGKKEGRYLRKGELVKAHEFHYWDSEGCGDACLAKKPTGNRSWDCMIQEGNLLAGFPHIYDPASPWLAKRFIERCRGWESIVG